MVMVGLHVGMLVGIQTVWDPCTCLQRRHPGGSHQLPPQQTGRSFLHCYAKKVMFLYSAVSSPLDHLKCYASPPVHSGTNLTSLGSIPAMQQLRANTICSYFHGGNSTTVYSQVLIYIVKRERQCPNIKMVAKGI